LDDRPYDLSYDPNEVGPDLVVECWIPHTPSADGIILDPAARDAVIAARDAVIKLVTATFGWLDEIFAPDNRQRVLEQIAAASTEPPQAVSQAASDLKDAGQRIDRLVGAVECGILAPDEVADKLRQLRDRRDRAKAVLAAAETTTGQLDPQAIANLLDQLGGLVAIESTLRDDERRAVLEESNLSIRYNHDTRTALFKVDLARGVSCVSEGGLETKLHAESPARTSGYQQPELALATPPGQTGGGLSLPS